MSFRDNKWVYFKGSAMIPKGISEEEFIEKLVEWCKENDWSYALTIDEEFSKNDN